MFLRQVISLLLAVSSALALVACDNSPGQSPLSSGSGVVDPEAYGAIPRIYPAVMEVRVANEFGGDILVTVHDLPQTKEVALDYTAYSTGPDLVRAAAEARRSVEVTMTSEIPAVVRIRSIGTTAQPPPPGQAVRLHVRVPRGVDLDLAARDGRIIVAGEVRNVHARATDRIEVRGAVGDLDLQTTSGGIVADGGNGHRIEVHSQNGGINIFSTDASVVAAITGTGGIEFVGTLIGRDNSFLAVTGPITVALPESTAYSFHAAAPGGRVLTDFQPARARDGSIRPVCGLINGGEAYDYHVRYLDDIYSHLDVSFANAGNYLSGTLGADIYYFFSDSQDLTFHTPYPQAIHILAENRFNRTDVDRPGQPLGVAECSLPAPDPPVRFTAHTQRGLIFIHHILLQP
jgi:hypothetical protein